MKLAYLIAKERNYNGWFSSFQPSARLAYYVSGVGRRLSTLVGLPSPPLRDGKPLIRIGTASREEHSLSPCPILTRHQECLGYSAQIGLPILRTRSHVF